MRPFVEFVTDRAARGCILASRLYETGRETALRFRRGAALRFHRSSPRFATRLSRGSLALAAVGLAVALRASGGPAVMPDPAAAVVGEQPARTLGDVRGPAPSAGPVNDGAGAAIRQTSAEPPPSRTVVADGEPSSPAASDQTAAAAAGAPLDLAIKILLDKAAFWDTKGQHDTALAFYGRVLAAVPGNADALAGAAAIEITAGHQAIAQSYIDRLRSVASDDPRIAGIESLRMRTPEELAALGEARRLAASGHLPEAVAAYQKVVKPDAVPADLALEYYPIVVAGSPPDSVEAADAISALGAIAEKSPDSDVIQLTYARAEISQEGNRADGIAKLRELTKIPSVAAEARTAWRAVLLWQGADAQAQQQLEAYLRENPSDPELEAKREEFRASLPSEGQWAKMRAYEAMRVKQMGVAEKEFQAALAFDGNDVDAIIMMAAIRQQQGKAAESRKLADRAVALAPERKEELLGILGEDPEANKKAATAAAQAVTAQYQEVAALTKKGSYDQAEQKLRRLMQKSPTAGNYLQLGDIQARAARLEDAAASLRMAMEIAPNSTDAKLALAGLLARQGKNSEATALEADVEQALVRSKNSSGLAALRSSRAARFRGQADALSSAASKVAPLRAALDLDPTNAWLRLDLARALRKSGAPADAQTIMAGLQSATPSAGTAQTEGLRVAFFWSQEVGDLPAAASAAERLPASQRTPDMVEIQSRVALRNEISATIHTGDATGNRTRLLALASQPDPLGVRGTEIVRVFLKRGDTQAIKRTVEAAMSGTPTPTQQQRLAYTAVLLEASLGGDARTMAKGIDAKSLTGDQRAVFKRLDDDLAADLADELIAQKNLPEAHELVAKHLADSPNNTRLNLALTRWETANGDSDTALTLAEGLVRKSPENLEARHAAIEAAIAAGELRRADPLIDEGLKRFPDDPFLRMEASTVARKRSNFSVALGYMEQARVLRVRQTEATQ